MIDSHSHIYMPEFDDDRADVVARCRAAGVERVILPNVDRESLPQLQAMRREYPDFCYATMGLHPTSVTATWRDDLDFLLDELRRGEYVAVGEVGMDLYWDTTMEKEQRAVLAEQLRVARDMGLAVIIHCREALEATLEVIGGLGEERPSLLFHSFTGLPADVAAVRRVVPEAFFGINGIVTFKNGRLEDTVKAIGLPHLLVETDSPYLAPVPHRGRRNESSYVTLVAKRVAEILSCRPEEVDEVTTATACSLFGI